MIATVLLIAAMFAILSLAGWCVLAPVHSEIRQVLLPAAPIIGAAVIAGVSSTATHWLSMPVTLAVVALVLAGCVAFGLYRGSKPWSLTRRSVVGLLVCPVLTMLGAGVAALPTIWVGDNRPVAGSVILDQFYFASNSTYLTDHSMLPGPYWNAADWAGSASPSLGPVVDVISNRLRYGQASVSSALSWLVGQQPAATVTSVSIMWLMLIGSAVFVSASLLGVRRRWALAAVPLATSSFYVTTQALEGKNDGILGVSLALLALALSWAVTRRPSFMWPLVVLVAGLAATYSELVLVLVAPVALLALVGSRRAMLDRINVVAGSWALGAVLTPWAWIWLAQSARIGGRYSSGDTPFEGREGLDLIRSVLGTEVPSHHPGLEVVVSVIAVLALAWGAVGLIAAVWLSPARGAAIGLVLALGALEISATHSHAGNLQYRAAQLGYAFVLLFALVGWDAVMRRGVTAGIRRPFGHWRQVGIPALVVAVVAGFSCANAATAASFLSRDRAVVQHVPASELDEAVSWIHEVGAANVSVVVPRFTDLIWLALDLRNDKGIGYPVIPAIYLGSFPHWDRQPDKYYLIGVGTTLTGDVTVIHENARYRLVELGSTGMIMTPFQPTYYWNRTTYMRGFPCARSGSQMLLIRGSRQKESFSIASVARNASQSRSNLDLAVGGDPIPKARPSVASGPWSVEYYQAPRFYSAIIDITATAAAEATGTTAFPVAWGDVGLASHLPTLDPMLKSFCLQDPAGPAQYLDGYDRNVSLLLSSG